MELEHRIQAVATLSLNTLCSLNTSVIDRSFLPTEKRHQKGKATPKLEVPEIFISDYLFPTIMDGERRREGENRRF